MNWDGHWTPPPHGALEINIDCFFLGNVGSTGIGGVARCNSSDIKFSFSVHKVDYTNNLIEAQAILYFVEKFLLWG